MKWTTGTLLLAALAGATLPADVARAQTCPGSTGPGAAIFIAGEATSVLDVFNQKGARLDGGPCGYNVADGFTVGDVDGDGADEIIIAGDVSHEIEVRKIGNVSAVPYRWFADYTIDDGLAAGNVLTMSQAHIVVAGDGTGRVDIFAHEGTLLRSWTSSMNALDKMAVGNVLGDDRDEILIAGDVSGDVDVYDADGNLLATLDLNFAVGNGFAAGNLDGVGYDEIVIAGQLTEVIDVFDAAGASVISFDGDYTPGDALAVGDVNADGRDEIVVAGDVSGIVDIFNVAGAKIRSFNGGFTALDGLAVGRNAYPDADHDGLLDNWEINGFDADGDTIIDVDLAPWTDPCHKDLLLEFDWVIGQEPTRRAVQAVKSAFALAPIDAGGTANPDGLPGINLIVDTGSLADPNASENVVLWADSCRNGLDDDNDGDADEDDSNCRESGAGYNSCNDGRDNDGDGLTDVNDGDCREGRQSCSDGVDNDGDGLVDGNDSDCLVGDNLGGGNGATGNPGPLDSAFYTFKSANFSSLRARIFRYGISGDGASFATGGRGEIGGNDFIEYNHDPGTIMHELGHNLNLRHGGVDDSNCKPNFISVMNYDHQGCIGRTDGSCILDYSPARRIDGTRGSKLPTLVEDALDETAILDPTEGSLLMIFTDDTDAKRSVRVDQPVDWEGDGVADDTNTTVNVDDEGDDGQPAACWNGIITSTLESHDDWPGVQLTFRGHADASDAAVNPELTDEMTLDEIEILQRGKARTDLAVTLTDSADPAIAGTTLDYVTTVSNAGKNPTSASHLSIQLPAGVAHVSTPGCFDGGDLVSCDLGMLFPGESRSFTTRVLIAADLVHVAGAPTTITATATIMNVAGPDPVAANDAVSQATLVKAVADLEMVSVAVAGAPAEILIGQATTVTLHESVTSSGPSSPMDARVTRSVVGAGDMSVTIAQASVVAPAVAAGVVRPLASDASVACTQPGARSFSLQSGIAPARPDDSDPNAANDVSDASVGVECVVPVSIRVMPVMKTGKRGVVPVEIRTTEAGEHGLPLAFDASLINVASVRFGAKDDIWFELGGASEDHGRAHGGKDRMLHFERDATGMDGNEPEACVKGTFTTPGGDTFKFFGCDGIRW